MTWEKILKIEPYERAVAEEFASKDMQEDKDREIQRQYEEMKPLLMHLAKTYSYTNYIAGKSGYNDNRLNQARDGIYSAIRGVLKSFPTAPKLAGHNKAELNLERIYEFLGEEKPPTQRVNPRGKTGGDD